MNIKIIIFSGTGNTRFLAKVLSDKLLEKNAQNIEILEVEDLLRDNNLIIDEETILGVAYPVYDLMPPSILLDYLDIIDYSKHNNNAFVFSTYTSYPLDSNSYIIDKLNNKGFNVIGSDNYKCPGASAFMYSNPNNIFIKSKAIFEKDISSRITSFAEKISNNKTGLKPEFNKFNKFHIQFSEFLFGNLFYKNLEVNNRCSLCEKCIKVCPTKNLSSSNNKLVIHKKNGCLKCLRCIQVCPSESINFTSSKRKGNYTKETLEKLYTKSCIK